MKNKHFKYFDFRRMLCVIWLFMVFISCTHEVLKEGEIVSKKEYDDLKKKYDELLAEKKKPEVSIDLTEDMEAPIIDDPVVQIAYLEESKNLINQGEFARALEKLKKVERSNLKQIKVRAKYFQGEIFFKQNEWDIALQKYDEIINSFAFSSLVIDAIEKKDACIKNLNKPIVQEPYHSIYLDFLKS